MWSESQWHCHYFLTSLVIVIRFFLGHVFILLGRLLRSDSLGQKPGALQLAPLRIFGVIGDFRASSFENSNCLFFGIWLKKNTSELILPRRDPSFSSLWCQDARDIEHGLMFCLSHHYSLSSGSFQASYSFFKVGSLG